MSEFDVDRLRRHAHDEQEEDDGLIEDAADEIKRLREEADWIRDKLKLPRDAKLFAGEKCVAGRLHVVCAHADGYERYIQGCKCSECNDKDGEMARLSVEIERLQAILPRTADEGPHDAEPYYFTRESR